jgi:hypothetical protein
MDTSPLKILLGKSREEQQALIAQLASGACKTYDEYKELCGRIRGLVHMEEEIIDLANAMESSDD